MSTAGIPFRKAQSGSALAASLPPSEVLSTALCAQVDPDLWFPEKGENAREAIAICEACPALEACRRWALDTRPPYGVFGGLSPRQRRRIRDNQHREAA